MMRELQDQAGEMFLALESADWERVKTWLLRGLAGLIISVAVAGFAVGAWAMGLSRDVAQLKEGSNSLIRAMARHQCLSDYRNASLAGIPCDRLAEPMGQE